MKRILIVAVGVVALGACTRQQRLQQQWDDVSSTDRANLCYVWNHAPGDIVRAFDLMTDHEGFSRDDVRTFLHDHC